MDLRCVLLKKRMMQQILEEYDIIPTQGVHDSITSFFRSLIILCVSLLLVTCSFVQIFNISFDRYKPRQLLRYRRLSTAN